MRTTLICLIGAFLLAPTNGAQGQSLGTVAKRTKEERTKRAPAKAYGAGDLQRAAAERAARGDSTASQPGGPATAEGRPLAAAETHDGETPAEAAGTDGLGRRLSETEQLDRKIERWRLRYSAAKARVDSLEKQVAALEEESETEILWVSPPDPADRRRRNGPTQQPAEMRLAAARKQLEQAQRELEAVTEQARLDGVSAGQLY